MKYWYRNINVGFTGMWRHLSCTTQTALQGRMCWPVVRTAGSSCHLIQGLPQLQPPGPWSCLSGSILQLETVPGSVIKALHFSLMWDSSDSQCSPQSSLPGWLHYYRSASEFTSLFYPVPSSPPFFHRYWSQINILHSKLSACREFDVQHSKKIQPTLLCFFGLIMLTLGMDIYEHTKQY